MYQQNRTVTEPTPQRALQLSLKAMVTQASREKLLPKIMWKADKQFGSKKLLQYQKSVHRQYDDDLKSPVKYDPEQAKTQRQKFRDKVIKLMNNQLQVDYFDNVKLKDKTVIAYQGHELQEEKIETKKEFEIFKNFNEKRFKETYSNLFDDKLEVGINGLYPNRVKKRCHTLHLIQTKPKNKLEYLKTQQSQPKIRVRQLQTGFTAPKTERKRQFTTDLGKKKAALIHFNEKKVVGKEITQNQQKQISRIMRQIGGYSNILREQGLTLTRESINRWLKTLYEKQARIVDFLQIKDVTDFNQFWNISKRLRVMPQQHILFMTFLYYDGNNDGYICDYDLERIASLSIKRPVLVHDQKKIKQSNIKKVLTKRAGYLDLYKRHEVTETVYFQWKNKQQDSVAATFEQQMKNRLLSSKQKQIFLDFSAFCSIYKFDKPFLWYDLMHVFGGVSFQGLRYE